MKEIKRRMLAAMIHHKVSREEVAGWLFYSSPGAAAGKLMTLDKGGRGAVIGDLVKNIEDTIIRRKIDLVAIDPFVKAHSVRRTKTPSSMRWRRSSPISPSSTTSRLTCAPRCEGRRPIPAMPIGGAGPAHGNDAFRLVHTLVADERGGGQAIRNAEEDRKQYVREDNGKVNVIQRWRETQVVPACRRAHRQRDRTLSERR